MPFKRGKRYFYFKNDGLQNQSILYVAESLADKGRILFDPNKLSKDGTIALEDLVVSPNGALMAYSLSRSGSDWKEWYFREVETGKDLPDVLKDIRQSNTSWTKDNRGVFYLRHPEPDEKTRLQAIAYDKKLYYQKLGTSQSEDIIYFSKVFKT